MTAWATAAGAAAGAVALELGLLAQAPARRQVTIGGKRVKVIDVHHHWDMPIPAEIVKGTPYEEHVRGGPGLDDRVPILDKMGIDVALVWFAFKASYGDRRFERVRLAGSTLTIDGIDRRGRPTRYELPSYWTRVS